MYDWVFFLLFYGVKLGWNNYFLYEYYIMFVGINNFECILYIFFLSVLILIILKILKKNVEVYWFGFKYNIF